MRVCMTYMHAGVQAWWIAMTPNAAGQAGAACHSSSSSSSRYPQGLTTGGAAAAAGGRTQQQQTVVGVTDTNINAGAGTVGAGDDGD